MPEGRPRPSKEDLEEGFAGFQRMAEKEGIKVNFNPHFNSSRLALEGAKHAQQKGKFHEYNKRVYTAQFIDSQDISDINVLTEIAEQAGLDRAEFKEKLDKRLMSDYVDADMEEAKRLQVKAAPTFFIGESEKIVGSKTDEAFENAMQKVLS